MSVDWETSGNAVSKPAAMAWGHAVSQLRGELA